MAGMDSNLPDCLASLKLGTRTNIFWTWEYTVLSVDTDRGVMLLTTPDHSTKDVRDARIMERVSPNDRVAFVYCNGSFVALVNRTRGVGRWWNLDTFKHTGISIKIRDYWRPFRKTIPVLLILVLTLPAKLLEPHAGWRKSTVVVVLGYLAVMAAINQAISSWRKQQALHRVKAILKYVLAH